MAERGARMDARPVPRQAVSGLLLRRKCASCGKHAGSGGECSECEKKKLRRKASDRAAPLEAPQIVHDVIGSPGRPLEADTRRWMEPRFGSDFSHVRVHDDSQAAQSARSVGALAYAAGSHVVFDHHQYAPGTPAGRHLLAHELAHTLQDPGASGMHASLAIGHPNDSTERAADDAADAVVRGDRVEVARSSGGVVRRQLTGCSASNGADEMQKVVNCPDGSETDVALTSSTDKPEPTTTIKAVPGVNARDVYIDISVCKGSTRLTITPSASVPDLVAKAFQAVLQGKDPTKTARLTAGLNIKVDVNETLSVNIGPSVTVDSSGNPTYGGSAGVDTPIGRVGGQASYNPSQKDWRAGVTLTWGDKTKKVDCHTVRHYVTFECSKVTRKPAERGQPEIKGPDTQVRRVYFDYMKDTIRSGFNLPDDIQSLCQQGYRISSILGFTSPEGPRGREHAPAFMGNDLLSKKRAEAAMHWVCNPNVCASCIASEIKIEGMGELPPLQHKETPEPKGRKMEEQAVQEFLGEKAGSTADATAPKEGQEREAFKAQPFGAQRDQAFEWMRRAEITLEGQKVTQDFKPDKKEEVNRTPVACDEKVVNAARKAFNIPQSTIVETTKP